MSNPYINLPAHQFWRKGVANIDAHSFDAVVAPKFRISREQKVSTAGSCFAQHISRRLSGIGFNYFVPESGLHLPEKERQAQGYGVFSARFGNVYTTRQLRQLFEEALGTRVKSEIAWRRADGRFVDAFRPNVAADGYESADAVAIARAEHLSHVRTMFLQTDIFIFTLGLTESWTSRTHDDVFPLAPGVAGGTYDPDLYKFVNLTVVDVIEDLQAFLTQLKLVNPGVKVLLTVSPVPLIATYEPKNVLVATTYSKSVLRVAAETASNTFDWVDYFPSYEIITGNFNGARYYEDDLREINSMGVSHAMRCFLNNYISEASNAPKAIVSPPLPTQVNAEAPTLGTLVCDEELIEKVSNSPT